MGVYFSLPSSPLASDTSAAHGRPLRGLRPRLSLRAPTSSPPLRRNRRCEHRSCPLSAPLPLLPWNCPPTSGPFCEKHTFIISKPLYLGISLLVGLISKADLLLRFTASLIPESRILLHPLFPFSFLFLYHFQPEPSLQPTNMLSSFPSINRPTFTSYLNQLSTSSKKQNTYTIQK